MKQISRHSIEMELVEEGVNSKKTLLESLLKSAASRASALSLVLNTGRNYAGYLAVALPESKELCRALRIGAQAAAAIFALAVGSREVEMALDEMRVQLPATGSTDASHVGNWRIGLWLAHIIRAHITIKRLANTPIQVLRRSSTRGDECQYLFAEALQAFEDRADDWGTKLHAAVDATDPETSQLSDEEFVLNILVPEMQMLFRLAVGEVVPFNEALHFALERHKKYWSKGNRKKDPNGFLALGPLAIAGMAYDAGMTIEVESEYLPKRLLEGGCHVP